MIAAFTPGPLEMLVSSTPSANNSFHLYLASGDRKLAALWGGSEEKLANGYLWSAAPEMLTALAECVAQMEIVRQRLDEAGLGNLGSGSLGRQCDVVRKLLAKAWGQA